MTTLFLSQLIGIIMVTVAVGLLLNPKNFEKIKQDFFADAGMVYLGGLTALILGLLIVLNHNIWDSINAGILSFIGWISVFKGITLIVFPTHMKNISNSMFKNANVGIIGFIYLLVGLYIAYCGFLAM